MSETITLPRVRHMWSRLPNKAPTANESDRSSQPPPEANRSHEDDDRTWDPADTPLHD